MTGNVLARKRGDTGRAFNLRRVTEFCLAGSFAAAPNSHAAWLCYTPRNHSGTRRLRSADFGICHVLGLFLSTI